MCVQHACSMIQVCKSEENFGAGCLSLPLHGLQELNSGCQAYMASIFTHWAFYQGRFVQFRTAYLCVALNNWHTTSQQCSAASYSSYSAQSRNEHPRAEFLLNCCTIFNFSLSNNPNSQSIWGSQSKDHKNLCTSKPNVKSRSSHQTVHSMLLICKAPHLSLT